MNSLKFIFRNIQFYKKNLLCLFFGVSLIGAILSGALLTGDSVRYSLKAIAYEKSCGVKYSLSNPNRTFGEHLNEFLENDLGSQVSSYLQFSSQIHLPNTKKRLSNVNLYGIQNSFFDFAGSKISIPIDTIVINEEVAKLLQLKVSDEILLTFDKPGTLSKDSAMSSLKNKTTSYRFHVSHVLKNTQMGNFSIEGSQHNPKNIFINLAELQDISDSKNRINGILVNSYLSKGDINNKLAEKIKLSDYNLTLQQSSNKLVLRSSEYFIHPLIESALQNSIPNQYKQLNWFVNSISSKSKSSPYSIVIALNQDGPYNIVQTLKDDEIVINTWLAKDLNVKIGDSILLEYQNLDQQRKKVNKKSTFTIKDIVPMSNQWISSDLKTELPGISEAEHCRDWDSGLDIDLSKIRPIDEDYWQKYSGTPKAFINYRSGLQKWTNPFGNCTALLFNTKQHSEKSLTSQIKSSLSQDMFGLMFIDLDEQIKEGIKNSFDFSGLFIALSFFLIFSALILSGLLFGFHIMDRNEENKVLIALGFKSKTIRNYMWSEVMLISVTGCVFGIYLGSLYTKLLLKGLTSIWVETTQLETLIFHGSPLTYLLCFILSLLFCFSSFLYFYRRWLKEQNNISPKIKHTFDKNKTPLKIIIPILFSISVTLFIYSFFNATSNSILFFCNGFLILITANLFLKQWLSNTKKQILTLKSFQHKNLRRNSFRSVSTVLLLSCGIFLSTSLSGFKIDSTKDNSLNGGTGGFDYLLRCNTPIYQIPNSNEGIKHFGFDKNELNGYQFIPFKKSSGDDASCLNLMRARQPSLYGFDPKSFSLNDNFSFSNTPPEFKSNPWGVLNHELGENLIPAVVDEATLMWNIKASIGDTLEYISDDGQKIKIVFVGSLKPSIFQGQILISLKNFNKYFSQQSGFNQFLIKKTEHAKGDIKQILNNALFKKNIDILKCQQRLNAFNSVQNTYISIFELLGSFGVLIGTLGLAVIIFRNKLERKTEFSSMSALGFPKRLIIKIFFHEHLILFIYAIGIGSISSIIALIPIILDTERDFSFLNFLGTIAIIFTFGISCLSLSSMSIKRKFLASK